MQEPNKIFLLEVGQPLRGITFKWKETTVLMVVKTYSKQKKPIVGFIECDTYYACWEYLYEYLTKMRVPLKWREDQWG